MDLRLSPGHVASVARCIDHIADQPGVPLSIDPPGSPGGHYLAATPDDNDAPVVIYRVTSAGEEGDFLVTALVDRASYTEYQNGSPQGARDHPLERALSRLATMQAFGRARITPPLSL
jgi:hypothetical protein